MRLRLALVPLLAVSLAGCQIVEANVRAVEVLANDDATQDQKTFATVVVAGTLTALTALAVAGTVVMTTGWSPDDPPPKDYVATELGWEVHEDGDDVTWRRCTSRIFCTEEVGSAPKAEVLSQTRSGRVVPVAMGGKTLDEVDLVELKILRHR